MKLLRAFTDAPEWDTRPPIVFESKVRVGQWFWVHPEGACGWETTRAAAEQKASA